jgi:hypothetical protein
VLTFLYILSNASGGPIQGILRSLKEFLITGLIRNWSSQRIPREIHNEGQKLHKGSSNGSTRSLTLLTLEMMVLLENVWRVGTIL